MTAGKLIVLEGTDGSGKKTQTKLLVQRLREAGRAVETVDFPRYAHNFFGGVVRRYLDGEFGPATAVNPYLASIPYAADRWESAAQLRRWLRSGAVVVLDRYVSSNLIHQAAKLPVAQRPNFISWLQQMEYAVFKVPRPNFTLYLHVPATVAYQLVGSRGAGRDGHEADLRHLHAAEAQCQALAAQLKWHTVECTSDERMRTPDDIADEVWRAVHGYLHV